MKIKKGDTINFRPEFQDAGDENHVFVAADDMENGRVTAECITTGMLINPTQVVADYMIQK